jgi:NADPH:quinone reductase-like Zn-dependent oxidoreductase
LNALHLLRTAEVEAGQRVVIHGAGGSIGTMAVQIARAWGAEVTAVDHGDKLPALRGLGAARVVDYTNEDFTRLGDVYDAIIDVAGNSPFRRSLGCLRAGGRYVHGNASLGTMIRRLCLPFSVRRSKRVRIALTEYRREDLEYLLELTRSGKLTPVVDRCYPLDEVVAAHRYVESGRKIGNVVLQIDKHEEGNRR